MQTSDAVEYQTRLCSLDGSNGRGGGDVEMKCATKLRRLDRERRERDVVPIVKCWRLYEEKFCSRSRTARLG
jgi:hypothetical protein